MSVEEALEDGEHPADLSNHEMTRNVINLAHQIQQAAAKIDLDLGLYLDPDGDRWGWADATPSDMVAAFISVKQAADELALVVKYAEQIAADALGDQFTVWVGDRAYKAKSVPRRTFPAEKKLELRDVMRRSIARKVALNPLTGELDEDRARVATETLELFDRWQTIDPAKFKTTNLKAEGVDVREFSETEWSRRVTEVPQ